MRKHILGITAVLALLLTAMAPGGIAASTELTDTTVDVDDDTEAVRAVATNITNDTASVTVYETVNGTETQVATGTLDTSTTTSDTYEYSAIDANASAVRVTVTGDGAESLSVNKVQVLAAGAGTTDDGSIFNSAANQVVALLVIAGGLAYAGREYGYY